MERERLAFERLLRTLHDVMERMAQMHGPHHDFGTGVPLCRAEAHLVQAIGQLPGVNVTGLAEHMGVTKGAISQMVRKLVSKKLVRRVHKQGNAKEVYLELTDPGMATYEAHEAFHMAMYHIVREYYGEQMLSKTEALAAAMEDVGRVMDEFERRQEAGGR